MNEVELNIQSVTLKHSNERGSFKPNVEAEMSLDGKKYIVKFDGNILTIILKGTKPIVPELSKMTRRYITDVLSAYVSGMTNRTRLTFKNEGDICEDSSCLLED